LEVKSSRRELDNLEHDLKRLLTAYSSLKTKYQETVEDLAKIKVKLEDKTIELKNSQNEDKISKIASSLAEESHKSVALKQKINEYIKEIDKCIAFLSE